MPLKTPVALVCSALGPAKVTVGLTPAAAAVVVDMTFLPAAWPLTETKRVPPAADSEAPKPLPDTVMAVPSGPDDTLNEAVGAAADANDISGAAIAINSSVVRIVTVVLRIVNLLILFISYFLQRYCIVFNPIFHRVKQPIGNLIFNTSVNRSRRQRLACIQA